ncbi:arginine--tRNA ligase [Aquihabitans sp. G128]|uniref:arginine--tRNA ligase n=1 Tax=Aquihabitans sp. G128 TaxID=2849779 RepID=UPI001C234170|nr:arginine--tRNA ligase [Aquihabitans sp. G128]QXC63193.1 arginine--tRNA ligase [Aquihabitans sp. G128]
MIRDDLAAAVREALSALGVDPLPERVDLERPGRREHGDWSSNVALATAKKAGRNPRELAAQLVEHLSAAPPAHVLKVDLAGPGFVNFHLAPTWLHDILTEVVEAGPDGYAKPDLGQGRSVNVEFVSANPTGPVHAGHARGAAHGDSVARLLTRTGHAVTREFYINDRGVQMQKFGQSLAARKAGEEPPEGGYLGEYVTEWAQELPDDVDPVVWGEERALQDQREALGAFGVHFDEWFSELTLVDSGAIETTLAELLERGVAYEQDGATWLRSTDHGDDKDRVLVKSDGEYTYLLPDIAYHRDKFSRAEQLINVWGADHHGYIVRMKAAMASLGLDADALEIEIVQMVDLLKDGEPMKLSKRAGTVVELRDIVDEVGADAARLTYLLQSIDSRQTVDLAEVASQGMDNPVYYVQMAHARIHGITRRADEAGFPRGPLADADLSLLTHERELDVLRALSELPDVVRLATEDRAPHKVTTWVRDLAGAFHGFYHDCYVVGDGVSPELTQARLWLAESARIGLSIGLDLLGVSAPETM